MIARRLLALPVWAVFAAALSLLVLSSSPAEAVAPVNDNFNSAVMADIGTKYNIGSTIDATLDFDEPLPACGFRNDKTVWYKFYSTTNQTVRVSTEGSTFDTVIGIYRTTKQYPLITDIAPVTCSDDEGTNPEESSLIDFTAVAGTIYYVQAAGYDAASGFLEIAIGNPQSNDNVASAIAVTPPSSTLVNTVVATTQVGETYPCGGESSVWFKATLPAGSYVAQNSYTSLGSDPVLAVYTGPPSSPTFPLTPVECGDDSWYPTFSINPRVDIVVTVPATYYFQVAAYGESGLNFTLNANPDSDVDGIADQVDNCPQTANGPPQTYIFGLGNQYDSDNDGIPGTQPPVNATWGGDACDVDDDDDDVLDTTDGCRYSPEDSDNWQDGDGCEDPDNDSDGICDTGLVSISCVGSDYGRYLWRSPLGPAVDCRNVAEDIDSFHDNDGCPESDNDYDNFPDGTDDCPATDGTVGPDGISDTGDDTVLYLVPYQAREDFDGIIDWDGCHDSPNDDYDGDGAGDETEVFTMLTDPVNPDTDADTVVDGTDNCPNWPNTPQNLPPWTVPATDSDCDGFTLAREQWTGTNPTKHCNLTSTANDEAIDFWPTDFNDSRITTLSDVALMSPVYNQSTGTDPARKRFDLNASGIVSLADVVVISPFYNKGCG